MTFERNHAPGWQQRVPGASWFKADLHVHTIDDHPGGKAKLPDGVNGAPDDAEAQRAYARRFLRRLIEAEVGVVGLTPHSPRAGAGPESSAAWRIVSEWNDGVDEDDVPFREKVYAVYPGFEINVNAGKKGVHLLVLFDPEIGRDRYLRLFDAVMDGAEPWRNGSLRMTKKDLPEILQTLDGRARDFGEADPADFLLLGAHLLSSHGAHREMNSQVLETFPLDRLAGLGLPESKLAEDFNEKQKPGRYWLPLMRKHRQAFFRGSDAYTLDAVGRRHTWVKLASPRIRALRQAFVASDSRLREAFERAAGGRLAPIADPPGECASRPWLRGVTVEGRAGFFGEAAEGGKFAFSPDLTCVIGGSMTGKSTLLDGLRLYTGAVLPQGEGVLRKQVVSRGANFQAGSAKVALDCPGSNPTAPARERWPAQFFAQNELQRLSEDNSAVEDILAKLDGAEAVEMEAREERLREQDSALEALVASLNRLDDQVAEAEQAEARARSAQEALEAFREAGVEEYHSVSRAYESWRSAVDEVRGLSRQVDEVASAVGGFAVPELDADIQHILASRAESEVGSSGLRSGWHAATGTAGALRQEVEGWIEDALRFTERLGALATTARKRVEQAMAERGHGSAELRQFQELSRQASLLPSYSRHSVEVRNERTRQENRFASLKEARETLLSKQRAAFDRVMRGIDAKQGSRIRGRRVDDGDLSVLAEFLESFKQRGITRWWRDCRGRQPTPATLLAHLNAHDLEALGMSPAVRATFREAMTAARRRQLAALRCRDRYVLELEVARGSYRPLSELSGGQRVSLLLTLLLETSDDRPLVIDQPEDELDNRFLFETVLPALKNLKGRRQLIVATHDANIVVNGDADMVIQLEATADKGRVACAGAIDDPAVRDAIVETVDGGREAFRLRRQKYGF